MRICALDTETYYDDEISVRTLGNWAYTRHPKVDPYLISVCDGSESWAGHRNDFNWDALKGAFLVSHNASFDSEVYEAMVEKNLAPRIQFAGWQCTANMSAALCNRRSLDAAVEFLFGIHVDKSARSDMKGKNWSDVVGTPQEAIFLEYARKDSYYCWKLWNDFSAGWSPFEQRVSAHTMLMCRRGIHVDVDRLDESLNTIQAAIIGIESQIPWIAEGGKPSSPKAIAAKCREVGIPCPPTKVSDDGESFGIWENTYGPLYPWIQAVADWRSANKVQASLETLKVRLQPNGIFNPGIKYFGAHTGRPSGEHGFNMLNLTKEPKFGVDMRAHFIPPPGCDWGIVDSEQIEPRVTHWLAGNDSFLSLIRDGLEIYEAYARQNLGYSQPEKLKGNKPFEKIRKTSKACVIGGNYGIGRDKFRLTAKKLADLEITDEESGAIITDFRSSNPEITDLWKRLETDMMNCIGGDYQIELPTGRCLTYRKVRRESRTVVDKKTGEVKKRAVLTADLDGRRYGFWGGVLTENTTQAFARDIITAQMLQIEDDGIPIHLHVYDENVGAVRIGDTEALQHMIEVMSRTPDFAPGLPISAAGELAKHYRK